MKILKKQHRNKAVCPPVVQGCVCEQKSDETCISFTIEPNAKRAYLFCAWNIGDETLEIYRHVKCPDDWKPQMVCGCPLLLTDACPDYMFFLPGHYWIKTLTGEPFADDFAYELIPVTREVADLYFAEKRGCCCG